MRNKFTLLLTVLLLFSLLITPAGKASALTNYVQDPSLEASYGSTVIWQQSSINSDSPVCISTFVDCTVATGGPRTGLVWSQFGGLDWSDSAVQSPELAHLSQSVTFPNSCGVSLKFYLWIGDAGGDANDVLNVIIDNTTTVFSANATQQSTYPSYTLVTVNLNPLLANGAPHTVDFFSRQFKHSNSQTVTFNLDDISVVPTCFTISGNAGTPGATLTYTGTTSGSATADGSGNYSFTVPADWSGTVTPSKAGAIFSPTQRTYTTVAANQTGQNYTATYTISGNAGTPGATLSYTGTTSGSATADISGNYSFTVPSGWSGTVTPSKIGFVFSPTQRTYTTVVASQTGQDYTATLTNYTISGNAGTPGATLSYTGTTSGSATANGSGNYSFTVPAGWSGTVTPSKSGLIFSPTERTYTTVAANQTGQDYTAIPGFTISGNVGVGSGVTLSYTDGTPKTVTSHPDGSYSIPVPTGWSGTVTPSHPCYNFTPANRPYTNVTSNKTNENYTPAINNSPVCGDTVGVFRPSNGALFLKNANTSGIADIAINYGLPGDYPVVGDWDGNGTATIGIYRNGSFYLRNSNTIGFADIVFPFGLSGDQPIAGDWNGDGIDTIGVFRNGTFYLRDSNSGGVADISFALGNSGDVGIAGDWNGDGLDTTGVFRPSNGALYLKNTNVTGFADVQINYGLPGDKPVTGDWNNDGMDTIGVYRNGTFYLRNTNTIGFADIVFNLGIPGDMPIAGDWDGIP
jgi:hypothetical protein